MTQYAIPVTPSARQTFGVTLSGQSCTVNLEWRDGYGLFLSLDAGDNPICAGRICLDRVPIVRRVGTVLPGDLFFQDTQGNADPQPDGLGSRWELIYDDSE